MRRVLNVIGVAISIILAIYFGWIFKTTNNFQEPNNMIIIATCLFIVSAALLTYILHHLLTVIQNIIIPNIPSNQKNDPADPKGGLMVAMMIMIFFAFIGYSLG